MDGRQKPDPQPENENELNDEQVIDLTQIVEGGDDGDVIDLTVILEEPDQALDDVVEAEEAVIPLVDAIPAETSANAPDDADEEVIDLMDMAITPDADSVDAEPEIPATMSEESVGTTENDVIDLMDVATIPADNTAETDLQEPAAEPDEMDDEIIDLTEVNSAPKTPAVEPVAESTPVFSKDDVDEEVIDLMDVATTPDADWVEAEPEVPASMAEESVGTTEDEDEVIDLLDLATTPEADTAETDLQGPAAVPEETAGTMEVDEPIIDLLNTVEPQTAEAETIAETDDEFTDLQSRAEAVLTDAVYAHYFETPEEAAETAGPDSDFMVFEDDAAIIDEEETPAIVDNEPEASPDIPEPAPAPLFVPVSPSEPISLTEAQVEAALERTIEKIYGEKIEQLMIRAIEKTVTREIARIKNALLEDDDDMVE